MTGFEPALFAAAKAVGPKVGMAAYRTLHPNDWARRLAKRAAKEVRTHEHRRVSSNRIRKWLKSDKTQRLIDTFVVADVATVADAAIESLDAALSRSRRWRKLPQSVRIQVSDLIVRTIALRLISVQDPSDAVDMASRRLSGQVKELQERWLEGRSVGSKAQFDMAVGNLPVAARDALQAYAENERVQRIVASLGDLGASPVALLTAWAAEPPSWLGDDSTAWAILGIISEEYMLVDETINYWMRAIEYGAARRNYWLLRSAWLRYEQSLADDDGTLTARTRELLDRITSPFGGNDAPIRALEAILADNALLVPTILDNWSPEDIADRGLRDRMLLAVALRAVERRDSDWSEVAALLHAKFDSEPLPRIGLILSRVLAYQVYAESSNDRVERLVDAYNTAIRVRDMFRSVRGPSDLAVKAAVDAAELAADERRVLRVGTDWQDYGGEATESERRNVAIAETVVAAALTLGEASRAREYAETLPAGYKRALCLAMCDDSSLPEANRRARWSDVLSLARNSTEKLPAWNGLARAGAAYLPGMREEIGESLPEVAASLEAAAAAARGLHEHAVQMLLPFARANMTAARQLATIYDDHGDQIAAAHTLLDAGIDFHNPDLITHAAQILFAKDEYVEAQQAIDRVLSSQGSEWAGRALALRLAGQIAAALNHIDKACSHFEVALRLEPTHVDSRWALGVHSGDWMNGGLVIRPWWGWSRGCRGRRRVGR